MTADRQAPSGRTVDVAVIQFSAKPGDVSGNVRRLTDEVRRYGPGADLVVAPELATTGYDLDLFRDEASDLAGPLTGPAVEALTRATVEVATTLVCGVLELADEAIYDALVTITPDGSVTSYRKTHLYPPEMESFAAGHALGVVHTPAGALGPLICFEHAFPEIATTLALRGAEILVIPSAVPIGYEHLLTLRTRARAQDNQVFAIGCDMTGYGFCGHSLVVGPRGEVLASAGPEETVLTAHLDLGAVPREREVEPALRLRRPELYLPRAPEHE